ncbi:MAG TPA: ATP-binding cassette domain-containing protein, partial [Daejeonella sp.]
GAGKTSLIRIINQITAPDSGEIYLNGEKLNPSHISKIGYLPEERGLYKKMEIGEQMLYLAQLKGLSRQDATERIRYWFEKMEIVSWWKKKVEDLSKGMQQKVQFIATVVHDPELIILDEPFSGFDPVNAQVITDEILELNSKGATIIFSTHRMESVEQLCDSIALIHRSKKILEGKVKEVKNRYRSNTYRVGFTGQLTSSENSMFTILSSTSDNNDTHLTIKVGEKYAANDVLKFLIPQVEVNEFMEVIPSMNDIFIQNVKN